MDIQQNNVREEKQQNGSENVPPPAPAAPSRGETKQQQSTIPPEKMETVSKGTWVRIRLETKKNLLFSRL